ncbi:MAG: ATP-binding protein [Nitrospirota bacterium]|nr:ATP-binding protein [Nitrospirota bacterium]
MITSFAYKGLSGDPWEFEETSLSKVNLLVGASGSGKTRFQNTLFNIATSVVRGEPFLTGEWTMTIKTQEYEYRWEYSGEKDTNKKNFISRENVTRKPLNSDDEGRNLIARTREDFLFLGNKLPKLQLDKISITLLKEEESLRPLYDSFSKVLRRKFHDEALLAASTLQSLSPKKITKLSSDGLSGLLAEDAALSAKMYLMKENHRDLYDIAVKNFTQIFPSIRECNIQLSEKDLPFNVPSGGIIPVFVIKEKGVNQWVALHELSSGMQKVLLIVTDILTLPEGSIYIIDEYENSLGVNAIDFLPEFIVDHGGTTQFLITTHHPYLINNMPMNCWKIFHRVGSKVSIKQGVELQSKYGASKQEVFIQLLNDPLYSGIQN